MRELVELSVAEVEKMAQVVRARIMHPSHTPVQAIRAGLAAVNDMRTDELREDARDVIDGRPGVCATPGRCMSSLGCLGVCVRRSASPRPAPRKVGRLTMAERGCEWEDVDGDRWRWDWGLCRWQYKPLDPASYELLSDNGWVDCPTEGLPGGGPSARYAPFTEVLPK